MSCRASWSRLAPVLLFALAHCTSDAAAPNGADPSAATDGSLRGELAVYVAHGEDGAAEMRYALRAPSGDERRLLFDAPPTVPPGAALRVWCVAAGEALRVARYEADRAAVQTQQRALINGTKRPERKWAFVLVDLGNGVNVTKERAQQLLYSEMAGSIRSYYQEASYGIQDLSGDVIGPLKYTQQKPCDTMGVAANLRPMVPGAYTQYLWYFGSRVQECAWTGLAAVGTAERPARDSWYNASTGCVVLVQEPGHNFGMLHSSSLRCNLNGTAVSFVDGTNGACTHVEYGNQFDPMGSGCYHMDGFQKAYQDWLAGCNHVKVTSSGTYTLFPLEKSCNGVQLL